MTRRGPALHAGLATRLATRLSAALQRQWWNNPPTWRAQALRPLAGLYAQLARLHRWRQRPQALDMPVVVIGNLIVGGAGKTPTTIAVVRLLRAFGSVKRMRAASVQELAAVPGIAAGLAGTIHAALARLPALNDVDSRRGRLVAVPMSGGAGDGDGAQPTAAADAERDVDSPDPGDYA